MSRLLLKGVAALLLLSACGTAHEVGVGADGVRPEAAGVNEGTKVQAPGIPMRKASTSPSTLAGDYGRYGGCSPGYGRGRACLPPVSPAASQMHMTAAEMPWTCADVRALLPRGIALDRTGSDPLGLDRDRDGTACGPKD